MEEQERMKQLIDLLNAALGEFKKRGMDYAQAFKDYRMLLSQELLRLKAEGMPVTICSDLARGKKEVADAKEQEIITECLYKSCQEAVNVYKLQIKILQNQMENDLNNGE